MSKTIKTEYVHPPVSFRTCDWMAYFDGEEETGKRGWGKTEAEAVKDLEEQEENAG